MSKNWVKDIEEMHTKFGVREAIEKLSDETRQKYIRFRLGFLNEELTETEEAYLNSDPEELVDGLIDLCVVAIGTLDAMGVDPYKAWDQVHNSNMQKKVGIKESRPNPLGLPDLIKPEGWVGPDHTGNHGLFTKTLK